jgi:hypothetical protein
LDEAVRASILTLAVVSTLYKPEEFAQVIDRERAQLSIQPRSGQPASTPPLQ